ncbi:hypothetical protein ACFX2A_045306 [Malus domestica]
MILFDVPLLGPIIVYKQSHSATHSSSLRKTPSHICCEDAPQFDTPCNCQNFKIVEHRVLAGAIPYVFSVPVDPPVSSLCIFP